MNMSRYWATEEQAWIMPTLWALHNDGTVNQAEDWTTLKSEVTRKLQEYGAGSYADELVEPLENAVATGADFKQLVGELTAEYEASVGHDQVNGSQVAESPADDGTDQLPDAEQLAELLAMNLGQNVAELIATEPGLTAQFTADELLAWIIEDVHAALDEIGKAELSA